MPHVNLSTLNGQELRQLLDSSRRRGDAALSYKVLQEMEARRSPPSERRPRPSRKAAEPHLVDPDLGHPIDAPLIRGEPLHADPAEAAPGPPREPLDDDRPLSLHDHLDWPEDQADTGPPPLVSQSPLPPPSPSGGQFQPVELGVPRKPPPRRFRLLAGIVIGSVLGIAIGWLGGWLARDAMSPLGVRPPSPVQTAALNPAPALPAAAPVVDSPAAPAAPISSEPAATQTSPDPAPTGPAPAPAPGPGPAPAPDGAALELPAPDADPAKPLKSLPVQAGLAPTAPIPTALAGAKGCAAAPTPADRAICGDPKLKRLQGELRQAYNQALDAHQDRALLRQRQLAWADARNVVADPDRLARLYEQRIRKLNAATAQARAAQQP